MALNTEGWKSFTVHSARIQRAGRRKWDFRDRFLDLLKRTLPRASDTADKRARASGPNERNKHRHCRGRDNLWNFPIPFTHKGGTRKLVCSETARTKVVRYVKANGQRRTESRRGRIEFPSRARALWFASRVNNGFFSSLSSFPIAVVSRYRFLEMQRVWR